MEDIELDDEDDVVFAKRLKTEIKAKTIFYDCSPYIMIEAVEIIDGGIFSGKSLSFTLSVPSKNFKVVRTEADFKWLANILEVEFPYVPIPPFI